MEKIVAAKTAKLGKTPEDVYADFASQTALGRFVEEEDIAAAIDSWSPTGRRTSPATPSRSIRVGTSSAGYSGLA
jgi:hypothetical protein